MTMGAYYQMFLKLHLKYHQLMTVPVPPVVITPYQERNQERDLSQRMVDIHGTYNNVFTIQFL